MTDFQQNLITMAVIAVLAVLQGHLSRKENNRIGMILPLVFVFVAVTSIVWTMKEYDSSVAASVASSALSIAAGLFGIYWVIRRRMPASAAQPVEKKAKTGRKKKK
ncbi:MAG: hypothetical protein IIY11_02575 [Clostridia bacterium]|nr:hypothetical protein [Clostridia bacterium]